MAKKLRDQATTRGASKATMGIDVEPGQDPSKSFVPPSDAAIAASLTDDRAVLKSSLPSPLAVETVLQETSEVVVSPAPPVDTISRAAEAPQEPRTVVHVWRCTQHPTHRISSTTVREVEQRCPVCSSPMSYAVEPA